MLSPPFARVVFNFTGPDGPPWQTELWYNVTGTFPSNYNIATTAALFDTDFELKFRNIMNLNYFYRGVDLHVNNGGVSNSYSTYKQDAGNGTTIAAPNEVAVLYRLVTAAAGAVGRGRIYAGGLEGSLLNAGRIDSTQTTDFLALAVAIKTPITDQGVTFHPGVYSRKGNLIYNLTDCVLELPLGTQRRRRVKR